MKALRWEDVREDWDPRDGTLRDVVVLETTLEDWERVRDLVASRGWRAALSVDGQTTEMPTDLSDLFGRHDQSLLWKFQLRRNIAVHCHFFAIDEMEFDVSVNEISDAGSFDALCEFVAELGRLLEKPVSVTLESAHDLAVMRYDPVTDVLVRVPPNP